MREGAPPGKGNRTGRALKRLARAASNARLGGWAGFTTRAAPPKRSVMSEQRATAPVLARDRERSCILARCMSRVLRALLLVAVVHLLVVGLLLEHEDVAPQFEEVVQLLER